MLCAEPAAAVLENGGQLLDGGGAEHCYARLAEVGNAFEDWRGGKMAASVEYAAVLVDAFHVDAELFLEYVNLAVEVEREVLRPAVEIVAHLLEYPRAAEGGTSHHDGIHAVVVESALGLFRRCYVAVAYDGYVYARIALHLAYASSRRCRCTSVHVCGRVW